MRVLFCVIGASLLVASLEAPPARTPVSHPAMSYSARKITAVLVVRAVEPSLEFWEKRLGFTRVAEVPHGSSLGFALLAKDGTEVMLQSEASVRDDVPVAGNATMPGVSTALFLEVDDLAAIEQALGNYPIAMPRRTTFYGMHEFGVLEPGGHWVTFAQPEKK